MNIHRQILERHRQLVGSRFHEHAAPEAIRHEYAVAFRAREVLTQHLAWLEQLASKRTEQIAAGTWPARKEQP